VAALVASFLFGQKKKLLFARALLINKSIILIYELFEDLCKSNHQQVCEILNRLSRKKTILIFSKCSSFNQLNIKQTIFMNQAHILKKSNDTNKPKQLIAK